MTSVSAVFLGDIGVGKTTFLTTASEGRARPNIRSTLGVDNIVYRDRGRILRCWDTSGSDRFIHVIPLFVRMCDIAVYVVDARRPQTFENVKKWHELVCRSEDPPEEHLIVVLKMEDEMTIPSYPGIEVVDGRYAQDVMRDIMDRGEQRQGLRRHASLDLETESVQTQCCFRLCL